MRITWSEHRLPPPRWQVRGGGRWGGEEDNKWGCQRPNGDDRSHTADRSVAGGAVEDRTVMTGVKRSNRSVAVSQKSRSSKKKNPTKTSNRKTHCCHPLGFPSPMATSPPPPNPSSGEPSEATSLTAAALAAPARVWESFVAHLPPLPDSGLLAAVSDLHRRHFSVRRRRRRRQRPSMPLPLRPAAAHSSRSVPCEC
jgi:hypothetical protein